jgi:hypothetical protein
VGTTDPKDSVLSPVYADLHGMPPTLFVTSTRDLLLSGTVILHQTYLAAGVDTRLVVFEAQPHAFWLDASLPESRTANEIMARFLDEHPATPVLAACGVNLTLAAERGASGTRLGEAAHFVRLAACDPASVRAAAAGAPTYLLSLECCARGPGVAFDPTGDGCHDLGRAGEVYCCGLCPAVSRSPAAASAAQAVQPLR